MVRMLDPLPINRSAAIAIAINNAHENPSLLARALEARLKSPVVFDEEEPQRIVSTLDPVIVTRLNDLEQKAQIPIEHVLRLAVEAFVLKL
jgi:hypothetical protein